LRRGKRAIHSKYSKEYAVYMGDYLFSESFLMLSDYDIPREVMKHLAQGISTICKAEMLQNHYRYDSKVSVEDYLKVISGKTAALFGISLSMGGNQAGVDEDKTNKLYEIGNNIGIAFQITDDILDFTSDEKTLGKEVKSDIIKGYYTLPLLLAFQSDYKKELENIFDKKSIDERDLDYIFEIVKNSGAIKKSEEYAEEYINKAINEINVFQDSRGKRILVEILPKLLKRTY
jgi:heptaprenyl diphosphate synthase